MTVLFVGDIHLKSARVLPAVDRAVAMTGTDGVVFLGDVCDDWNDRLRERFASLRTENLAIPAGRDLVLTRERQLDEYFSKLDLHKERPRTIRYSLEAAGLGREAAGDVALGLDPLEASGRALGA